MSDRIREIYIAILKHGWYVHSYKLTPEGYIRMNLRHSDWSTSREYYDLEKING